MSQYNPLFYTLTTRKLENSLTKIGIKLLPVGKKNVIYKLNKSQSIPSTELVETSDRLKFVVKH